MGGEEKNIYFIPMRKTSHFYLTNYNVFLSFNMVKTQYVSITISERGQTSQELARAALAALVLAALVLDEVYLS